MKNQKSKFQEFDQISKPANIILTILFALIGLACVLPFIFIIIISFTSEASIQANGYSFFPKEFSVSAYKYLWNNKSMLVNSTMISLFVTSVGTIIGLLLTTAMGYVLSRKEYKFRTFFTWVVFVPMVFNGGIISTYYINTAFLSLKDSVWSLILPLLVSGFNVIVCRTFFTINVPDSIVESAKIDGASQFKIFFGIIIPICLPLLATIALFLIFAYWNDWWQAMLYIVKPDKKPLQSLLLTIEANIEWIIRNQSNMGASSVSAILRNMPRETFRMAIAVVVIIPISIVYPFFQRYFISGLTVGAVKG